jgi:tetratricopeptide (TPR) repeat protein
MARVGTARCELALHEETGDEGCLERAVVACDEALRLDDRMASAHHVRGTISSRRGDDRGAIEAFRKAIQADPAGSEAPLALALVHRRRGDSVTEEETLRSAIEARPHYWRYWWWLGALTFRQGRFVEAKACFRRLTELAPEYALGHAQYGGLLVLEGDYERAERALRRSIGLKPTDIAFSNLATAYFNHRHFEKAIQTYQEAFSHGYINFQIWANLGDAFHWTPGKRDLAPDAYRQAVELARTNELRRFPNDANVLAQLGDIYPKLGQPDSARIAIERALALDPRNANVQYLAALACWQIGRRNEALERLQTAVKLGYPSVWIRDSAVFDDWRSLPQFQQMMSDAL